MRKGTITGFGIMLVLLFSAASGPAVDFKQTGPKETTLAELEAFHGHLGPYVAIGARVGDMAMRRLDAKRFSEIHVLVECAKKPPQRCAIDGLQVATGATFGKGNIELKPSAEFRIRLVNTKTKNGLEVGLTPTFAKELEGWFAARIDLHEQTRRAYESPLDQIIEVRVFVEKS